jgi:hypothetical protein
VIGKQERWQEDLFVAGPLSSLIPEDHILKRVDAILDLSWLSELVKDTYCTDNGRRSIDPEAALRLMLAGFFEGITQDRKLMRQAQVNLAMRWFAGYRLHESLPDHSSLTRIRQRWIFDSGISYPPYSDASPYSGMGNHNIGVADVDGDGKDEIVYGAMVVDDNGVGLCTSGLRHGDALHVGDLDPSRPGLEVFGPHENEGSQWDATTPGAAMYDARTGEVIFGVGLAVDVGRGVAEDIDPTYPGCENWGGPGGLRDCHGNTITTSTPASCNFVIWWDADLTRELLDNNHIDKWNWTHNTTNRLLTAAECSSNNGTKAVPCLTADILGDWREEAIWRTTDNTALHIYTTTTTATNRIYTLMHDPQYRLSIAWQNGGYNQPPHPSFYLGDGMSPPPTPDIKLAKEPTGDITGDGVVNSADLVQFVGSWLNTDYEMLPELNLNGDCTLNYLDFAIFADNWLK